MKRGGKQHVCSERVNKGDEKHSRIFRWVWEDASGVARICLDLQATAVLLRLLSTSPCDQRADRCAECQLKQGETEEEEEEEVRHAHTHPGKYTHWFT